jgi:hypothetical protein
MISDEDTILCLEGRGYLLRGITIMAVEEDDDKEDDEDDEDTTLCLGYISRILLYSDLLSNLKRLKNLCIIILTGMILLI